MLSNSPAIDKLWLARNDDGIPHDGTTATAQYWKIILTISVN
jgi:hypothetical protein